MTRTHAAFIAIAVALAAVAGTFAALHTTQLGASAHTTRTASATIVARTHALDRTEHALLAALRQKPPALPKVVHPHPSHAAPRAVPVAARAATAAPHRVVYVRPAPIVHVLHHHGEPGDGSEHGDGGGHGGGGGGGGGGND